MPSQFSQPSGQNHEGLLKVATYGLLFIYLMNCLSPLRLHVDTLRYFAIRDCLDLGCPPDSEASRDYLPIGYTALLLFLSRLHLLRSFFIVLINCVYLFAGLWFVKKLFGPALRPFLFMLMVLLNWTVIKFVTHPLSEMQYLFFSMASLYYFHRYSQNRKIISLLASLGLGALAFLTRSVGVALIAALLAGLVWHYRKALILLIQRHRTGVFVIILVFIGVIIFSRQLGLNHYTGVFNKQFREGLTFTTILNWHFTEWSEIGLNLSVVKLFPYFPAQLVRLVFILAGVVLFAGFAWLLFFRRNSVPFIVKAYLLFYSVLMFDWPFYDPRFWVPVIPLIAASLFLTPFPKGKPARILLPVFFAFYICLGAVSVIYMTYTSLNRKVMARTQANGVYRNEYETVLFGRPLSDTAHDIDPAVLSVLKRFD
jgi:hypothetical protein